MGNVTELQVSDTLFPGFGLLDVATSGTRIRARVGGKGPPLLLLHGNPQTHAMWHKVAPRLAARFTLVMADLRGYGDSGKPATTPDHRPYSKRAMALDMAEVMTALGHARFAVAGHDRGGRVAHRLALDHEDRVTRLAVLDIAPTREMYRGTGEGFARAYWHWFFMIQPAPAPERMISADPVAFLIERCGAGKAGLSPFAPAAMTEYLRAIRDPAMVHGSCEDYRASATIDIAHDDADGGRKVTCPLLAIWGEDGIIGRLFDPLALWRLRAEDVRGFSLPSGHYLAEERPEETATALLDFLTETAS